MGIYDLSSSPTTQPHHEDTVSKLWETITIMLSITLTVVVFIVLMLQVLRLLQGRESLPSLSSLQTEDEHDRLKRIRYTSTRVDIRDDAKPR